MINESLKVTGHLDIVLQDVNGSIKQKINVPNLVVTTGKNLIASRLIGTTSAIMSHMAVGSDGGTILPLATSNIQLGTQIGARVPLTSTTILENVVTYTAEFGTGVSTGAIVEAGIFNAATAGNMLCRTTFPVINKEADDILTINWNVTIN